MSFISSKGRNIYIQKWKFCYFEKGKKDDIFDKLDNEMQKLLDDDITDLNLLEKETHRSLKTDTQ